LGREAIISVTQPETSVTKKGASRESGGFLASERTGPGTGIPAFPGESGLACGHGPKGLLNVRAGNMSAFSDQPDHFLEWLQALPEEERMSVSGSNARPAFASRQLYGSYIRHVLAGEIRSADRRHRLSLIADEAVALRPEPDGYRIEIGGGRQFAVDAVALTVGNCPPEGESRDTPSTPGLATRSHRSMATRRFC
jgi:uncharacterized NAD(P)/FAD-binding protein YdhS